MENYQKTVLAMARAMFALVPIVAVVITILNAFDHRLGGEEIGALAFIILVGVIGFFTTRLIQRVMLSDRP